jgi:hypothetical protein
MGINNEIKENEALIEFWTNTAGQDIPVEIEFDGTPEDFVKKFTEYAENYNVDEEVEFLIYIGMRDKQGVPCSVRELTDDCQEAKDTLMNIAKKLQAALKNTEEDTEEYYVTFKMEARYCVKVRGPKLLEDIKILEDIKKEAESKFSDADFGEAEDIDGEIISITDEDDNDLF